MRAVIYANPGDTSVLQFVERPPGEPAEGEVRIRVIVSGVNPTDWKSRSGAFGGAAAEPTVPNHDGAGRPARRRGRCNRVATRPLRPRRDRAHEVLYRPGDTAGREQAHGSDRRFRELCTRPAQQEQWARLQALGLNTDSELERSLGRRVVESIAS